MSRPITEIVNLSLNKESLLQYLIALTGWSRKYCDLYLSKAVAADEIPHGHYGEETLKEYIDGSKYTEIDVKLLPDGSRMTMNELHEGTEVPRNCEHVYNENDVIKGILEGDIEVKIRTPNSKFQPPVPCLVKKYDGSTTKYFVIRYNKDGEMTNYYAVNSGEFHVDSSTRENKQIPAEAFIGRPFIQFIKGEELPERFRSLFEKETMYPGVEEFSTFMVRYV